MEPEPRSNADPHARSLVERLYVFWLASTVLLALLVVIVAAVLNQSLARQARQLSTLHERLRVLEQNSATASIQPQQPATVEIAVPTDPPAVTTPSDAAATEVSPDLTDANSPQPPGERNKVVELLSAALQFRDGTYAVRDPATLRRAVELADRQQSRLRLTGEQWRELAIAAQLTGAMSIAEEFVQAAARNETDLAPYYEVAARVALANAQPADAILFAERLAQVRPASASAYLYLAEAWLQQGEPANADLALAKLEDVQKLTEVERVTAGNLAIRLERWDLLRRLLAAAPPEDPELQAEVAFQTAVAKVQDGEYVEALAILDYLLKDALPGDYDVQTWRGVALLESGQSDAAREVLAPLADNVPQRPEAAYWLGILEMRAGNPEVAVQHLQRVFAAAARYAPAWEALGALALDRGDLAAALTNIRNALSYNPRRASGHLLLAVTLARAEQKDEATEALQTALALEPNLVQAAENVEVLRGMYSDEEWQALIAATADFPAP